MTTDNPAADIEDIKQLKSRYFRFIDLKLWDDFELLFTEDADYDMSGELERFGGNPEDGIKKGKSDIRNFVETSVTEALTVHHGHTPEIEIVGPNQATGIWVMEDLVDFSKDETPAGIRGYGHYYESYEKLDDKKWYISKLKLVRLRVDLLK